jgi:hypothetical protein
MNRFLVWAVEVGWRFRATYAAFADMTHVPIQFSFGSTEAPVEFGRAPASNEYIADINSHLTGHAGDFELIVNVTSGYVQSTGGATRCVLLRRNIAVIALNAQMSVGGAVLGVLLVALLVLVIYLIRSHKEATKRILISFVKHEVLLAVKISFDLWVRSPECTPCLSRLTRLLTNASACRILAETVRFAAHLIASEWFSRALALPGP